VTYSAFTHSVGDLVGELVVGDLVGELVVGELLHGISQVLHVTGQPSVTASFLQHLFT